MKDWYEIKAQAQERAEVYIYESIGDDWSGDSVAAKHFVADLAALDVAHIDLRINSPGGSVFDGQAIYNALVRHPAEVTSHIDGVAASIASVVALAGDRVLMADNALFMIHDPFALAIGTAADMRHMADVLDHVTETIVGVYVGKTGRSAEEIKAAMAAETWYTAAEAQAAGFVDATSDALPLAASATFDLRAFGYRNVPASFRPQDGATRFEDLPLADDGRMWDADTARKNVQTWAGGDDWDPAQYRRAFLWYDSARPELLGSYKLPFADIVDGALKAVPRGVFACAGSHGIDAADIPAADKERCRAHLARYYEKMGRTPPWEDAAQTEPTASGAEPASAAAAEAAQPKADLAWDGRGFVSFQRKG